MLEKPFSITFYINRTYSLNNCCSEQTGTLSYINTVIGPVLFILHSKDLPQQVQDEKTSCFMYADNTIILVSTNLTCIKSNLSLLGFKKKKHGQHHIHSIKLILEFIKQHLQNYSRKLNNTYQQKITLLPFSSQRACFPRDH